jgi:hypothetical protein
MEKIFKLLIIVTAAIVITAVIVQIGPSTDYVRPVVSSNPSVAPERPNSVPTATPMQQKLPATKILNNDLQVFQTFNNCSPGYFIHAISLF